MKLKSRQYFLFQCLTISHPFLKIKNGCIISVVWCDYLNILNFHSMCDSYTQFIDNNTGVPQNIENMKSHTLSFKMYWKNKWD